MPEEASRPSPSTTHALLRLLNPGLILSYSFEAVARLGRRPEAAAASAAAAADAAAAAVVTAAATVAAVAASRRKRGLRRLRLRLLLQWPTHFPSRQHSYPGVHVPSNSNNNSTTFQSSSRDTDPSSPAEQKQNRLSRWPHQLGNRLLPQLQEPAAAATAATAEPVDLQVLLAQSQTRQQERPHWQPATGVELLRIHNHALSYPGVQKRRRQQPGPHQQPGDRWRKRPVAARQL